MKFYKMETHTLSIDIEEAFGNLHRDRCVLIAATDQNGAVLLGEKPHFYPPSIVRLLGGGVEEKETWEEAAKREIGEELLGVGAVTMTPLLHIATTAQDANGREFHNETRVFHTSIHNRHYQAGSDVARIIKMRSECLAGMTMANCMVRYIK